MKCSLTALALLPLVGCAGYTHGFYTELRLNQFLTELHLTELPPSSAAERLTSLGFACKAASAPTEFVCEASFGRAYGGEWDTVTLSPVPGNPERCTVTTAMTTVVV